MNQSGTENMYVAIGSKLHVYLEMFDDFSDPVNYMVTDEIFKRCKNFLEDANKQD
jgi:hypothetical protein